jgi:hypothetical protein
MIRIMIAWIWLFHIVASTVGVSVHKVYCLCSGQVSLALVQPRKHLCAEQTAVIPAASCCVKPVAKPKKEAKSCCKPSAITEPSCASTDKNCMQDEVLVLQLDGDFSLVGSLLQTDISQFTLNISILPVFSVVNWVFEQKQHLIAAWRGPPDRPHGKSLLPFHQTWLC